MLHCTAVVLLHGLRGTPDELLSLQGPLRQQGYTVVLLRIAGYSFDAAEPECPASPWYSWVQAVQARVLALRQDHDKVVVVSLSAGCALALAAAMSEVGTPEGLVLLSTTLRYDGWGVSRWRFLLPLALYTPLGRWWPYRETSPFGVKNERIRAWIEHAPERPRIAGAGRASPGLSYLRENDRLIRHVRRHLSAVRCTQVLAIHAQDDEVASPRNLQLLAQGLPASCSLQAQTVHNSYHMISIDNDRQEVVRRVQGFVQSCSTTHHGVGDMKYPAVALSRNCHKASTASDP